MFVLWFLPPALHKLLDDRKGGKLTAAWSPCTAADEEELVSRVRGGLHWEGLGPYPEGEAHDRWERLTRHISAGALHAANIAIGSRISPGGESPLDSGSGAQPSEARNRPLCCAVGVGGRGSLGSACPRSLGLLI